MACALIPTLKNVNNFSSGKDDIGEWWEIVLCVLKGEWLI